MHVCAHVHACACTHVWGVFGLVGGSVGGWVSGWMGQWVKTCEITKNLIKLDLIEII